MAAASTSGMVECNLYRISTELGTTTIIVCNKRPFLVGSLLPTKIDDLTPLPKFRPGRGYYITTECLLEEDGVDVSILNNGFVTSGLIGSTQSTLSYYEIFCSGELVSRSSTILLEPSSNPRCSRGEEADGTHTSQAIATAIDNCDVLDKLHAALKLVLIKHVYDKDIVHALLK